MFFQKLFDFVRAALCFRNPKVVHALRAVVLFIVFIDWLLMLSVPWR